MCLCDELLARIFRPHQIIEGSEYGTHLRFQVTGFRENLCPICRGEVEQAYPMAAVRGRKSKIERFYWREITKTYYSFVLEWLRGSEKKVADIIEFQKQFPTISKSFKKKARQHWQKEHNLSPKYDMSEPTQQELHTDFDIPEVIVYAPYQQVKRGDQNVGRWQNANGKLTSAESVSVEFYQSKGWQTFECERKLISILYGTFCFPVIQDILDPKLITGYRNSTRGWTPANRNTGIIAIPLPEDFGSNKYFIRRREQHEKMFTRLRNSSLIDLFDHWVDPSETLRDYLWVNDDSAISLARSALNTISSSKIIEWIEWAAQDFWNRQPGWPDLLLLSKSTYKFSEIKSPHDKLSQEQLSWFRWALDESKIPCEICRVKKKN